MSLRHLLSPRSVAIVGASDKIGPGFNAWKALEFVGFEGAIHLINPNKGELFGRRTLPSLADVADEVDAVFVAVQAERIPEIVRQATSKGVGGIAILSSGFAEAGETGAEAQRQLARIAAENGIAVCGPNCLGLLNFAGKAALFGTSLPESVARGGVAAIVQSGSIGIALLNAGRGLGLSHLITSGNEAVTAVADYLEALVEDPEVKSVIAFLEQLRKPAKFIAAAARAKALGKPVIVLKSGRSAEGRAAVMAHTGAVAGSVEVCRAAFRAAGVIEAGSLDELVETAVLVSGLASRPQGEGVGVVSLSGGEIALALDVAEEVGLTLAPIAEAKAEIAALLPEFAHIANPLDLTWAGLYDPTIAERIARAMGRQGQVGTLVLLQDAPRGLGTQQATRYSNLLRAVAKGARAAGKPLVAVSNLSGDPHPGFAAAAAEEGVPYLRGTREGLLAVASFARWAAPLSVERAVGADKAAAAKARNAWTALPANRLPAEHEARAILASYGLAGPRERFVTRAEEVGAAAAGIGFPVVLKGVVANLVHKSDAGLVKIGIRSADEARHAAAELLDRAARLESGEVLGLLVQETAAPVAELLVGARVDPEFGPIVVAGGGGVLVELYDDVAIRLAPVDEAAAGAMIAETRASKLLAGWRGKPAGDLAAVSAAIVALSRFIVDFADEIAEVEVNPLAVFAQGKGCSALDCLIVPKRRSG